MKKEELISAVGKALNASGKDETIAFDIFLRKITDKLDVEGVLKVPEIGIFQLSRFRPGPQQPQPESGQSLFINVIPQESSQPGTAPGIITLPAAKKLNDSDFDDSFFSLSVDQPLIPVADSRKSEFIVQSNYAKMQREFEDIADNLIAKAIPLEDFNLFKTQTEEYVAADSDKLNNFVEPETDNSPVSWDFSEQPEIIKEAPPVPPVTPKPLDPEFEMIGDLLDPDDLDPFMNEIPLNEPEIPEALTPEPDPFMDENIVISEDIPSEDISLNLDLDSYDDLLNSPDEPGADEFGLAEDTAEDEDGDLNKKLDLLVGMNTSGREVDFQYDEEFLAEDPEEDTEEKTEDSDAAFSQLLADAEEDIKEEQPETEEETGEESETESQPVQAAVPPASGDMVELGSRKKIGSVVFWIAAASFILLTSATTYYFLFMRGKSPDHNTAANTRQEAPPQAEIRPEIIERNNDIPVTAVIAAPEENKNSQAQAEKPASSETAPVEVDQTPKSGNEAAKQTSVPPSVDNSKKQAPAQIPGKTAAAQDLNAKKTAEEKQNRNAAGINAGQSGNAKENSSAPADTKTAGTKTTETKTAAAGTEETFRNLFRNDNKDKMVKSNIFTDGNKYAIQMSSWPQVAKAASEVNKYRGMGYQSYIVKFKLKNDKPWYRVRIGDFSNINEAEAVVARIRK